ncbi:MAG: glutamate 5-kinase [Chlorobium phaeobacteroides]|uniref:Glutamate 5-kinase n=1 Tax=Chlorobium phaeobacteroides (strain BS1) TaxID=331678 RepID=B3EPG1_CHLPB|nr:glutamate 5-kinase [Chlorobium phaeobacteroides]
MSDPLYQKIVIKVGTNVITDNRGELDLQILEELVSQISELRSRGVEVFLVSSGAVAAGRAKVTLNEDLSPIAARQVLSSTGQIRLINTYTDLFEKHALKIAQILVTKSDFRDRQHYLNIRTCLESLMKYDIIPVINENDAVSVTELMFTDNDELSGLIASMMHVDAYIILSHIDGLFDLSGDEKPPRLITSVDIATEHFHQYIKPGKSEFGRGGMLTKCHIAQKLSRFGIAVHIANGQTPGILLDLLDGKAAGTRFVPQKPVYGRKRWIAHSEGLEKGAVTINTGAEKALRSQERANSLLPVGIESVLGAFYKGDIIRICSENEETIGYGMARYSSEETKELMGKKGAKPLIHYDYLYLMP